MTGTSKPLVSEIVLCYNQARFVVETLETVKAQTYAETELIIVDDFSTDNSVATIDDWIHKNGVNCTFIRHSQNLGICRALNDALAAAKGKYISLVAADDLWLPGKIAGQVEQMESASERIGVLYSDAFQIDEDGKPLPAMFISAHRQLAKAPEGNIHRTMLEGNFIPAMTTLIRRNCFAEVGPYDEHLSFEDWDMWIRISRSFDFAFSPTPSAKYRIVSTSLMRANRKRFDHSVRRLLVNYLRRGWLEGMQRETAIDYLSAEAREAYLHGLPDRNKILLEAFKFRPRPAFFLRLLLSACHVSYKTYLRGAKAYRALKQLLTRASGKHWRTVHLG